jgi:hypothetical protein
MHAASTGVQFRIRQFGSPFLNDRTLATKICAKFLQKLANWEGSPIWFDP